MHSSNSIHESSPHDSGPLPSLDPSSSSILATLDESVSEAQELRERNVCGRAGEWQRERESERLREWENESEHKLQVKHNCPMRHTNNKKRKKSESWKVKGAKRPIYNWILASFLAFIFAKYGQTRDRGIVGNLSVCYPSKG